jgi:hypothetical protein
MNAVSANFELIRRTLVPFKTLTNRSDGYAVHMNAVLLILILLLLLGGGGGYYYGGPMAGGGIGGLLLILLILWLLFGNRRSA